MVRKKRPKVKKKEDNILDEKKLRYYKASEESPDMVVRGEYEHGYPQGAVIHYTGGRSLNGDTDAINTMLDGASMRHCYFCISNTGTVYQGAPLNKWGYHAGKSFHDDLGDSLSSKLVGIELCCAGKLEPIGDDRYASWFKEAYVSKYVRESERIDNIQEGFYHKFTMEQEESLTKLLVWLKKNNPDVFKLDYVFGHDEITDGRKSDPGGSLSMTMCEYRNFLKEYYGMTAQSKKTPFVPYSLSEEFGVVEIQRMLNTVYGYSLIADGIPGRKTSDAIKELFGFNLKGDPRSSKVLPKRL